MKTVHCACGFKFKVGYKSKVLRCYECVKKTKNAATKGKKPLDVAFSKIDEMLADKKKGP